jgi:branched-chain amino acid transport system ATP-binding protein
MALLEVREVSTYYGNIRALDHVSLAVDAGEIVTLIGSNGAGKTTLLKTIAGLLRPRTGQILLRGERLDRLPPHEIVRRGVCLVPEGRQIFPRMTVLENLEMGAFTIRDPRLVAESLEQVFALFPRLKERRHQIAGTLSGGEQQMLAIGRALMARPRLLLLDEPSMGLAPLLVATIFEVIRAINAQGIPILLVEQNAYMALQVAQRGYVLQTGRIVLADTAAALRANELVRRAYLGELV